MTNGEFLRALFSGLKEGCSATLHSFPGDPGDPGENPSWAAVAWNLGSPNPRFPDRNNNYVCVSSFVRSGDGVVYRRKILFSALHAVMIDDLGTKLPMSDLRLKPSALIETSPGNYQAWLFLANPIDRITKAEALIDAMIANGITAQADPGMKGVTRVARLPQGCNGKKKYGAPFPHRVVESNLHTLYTPEAIAATYGLTLVEKASDDVRAQPRLGIDPKRAKILDFLKVFGHYQHKVREGYHAILCPFWSQHSERGKSGTYFMEPGPGNSWVGGFTCNHGHCSDYDINDLVGWLEAQQEMVKEAARGR